VLLYRTIYMLGVSALLLAAGGDAYARTTGGLKDVSLIPPSVPALQHKNTTPRHQAFDKASALKTSQAAIDRTLTGYSLRNRHNRPVRLSDYRGKPLVISLIYTSCFHICPATTQNLARAVHKARSAVGKDKFNVITVGFDALHDTPERMRGFAHQQGVSGETDWAFLSADKATIARLSADLGFLFTPSVKGYDHLIQTTVIDENGEVYRQIYGMNFDQGRLTETMKELVFGLVPKSLSLSDFVNRARLYCTHYNPATGAYQFDYAMVFAMGTGAFVLTGMGIFLIRFLRHS